MKVTRILVLKTSSAPLAESFFDPQKYYVQPPASRLKAATILFTNDNEFSVANGHLQKVFSASEVRSLGGFGPSAQNIKSVILVRLTFLGFLVLSVIGLSIFIWRHMKQQKTNTTKGTK